MCQRAAEGPAPGPIPAGQDPRERGQQHGMAHKNASLHLDMFDKSISDDGGGCLRL